MSVTEKMPGLGRAIDAEGAWIRLDKDRIRFSYNLKVLETRNAPGRLSQNPGKAG